MTRAILVLFLTGAARAGEFELMEIDAAQEAQAAAATPLATVAYERGMVTALPDEFFNSLLAAVPQTRAIPSEEDVPTRLVVGLGPRERANGGLEIASKILRAAQSIDPQARLLRPEENLGVGPILLQGRRRHGVLEIRSRFTDEMVRSLESVGVEIAALQHLLEDAQWGQPPVNDGQLRSGLLLFDGKSATANLLRRQAKIMAELVAAAKPENRDRYSPELREQAALALFRGMDPFLDALGAIGRIPHPSNRRDPEVSSLRNVALRGYMALQATDPAPRNELWRGGGFGVMAMIADMPALAQRVFDEWLSYVRQCAERTGQALQKGLALRNVRLLLWTRHGEFTTRASAAHAASAFHQEPEADLEPQHMLSLFGVPAARVDEWSKSLMKTLLGADFILKFAKDSGVEGLTVLDHLLLSLKLYPDQPELPGFLQGQYVQAAARFYERLFFEPLDLRTRRLAVEAAIGFVKSTASPRLKFSGGAKEAIERIDKLTRAQAAELQLQILE